jgi:predicted negative regulator of RcsB-dependent stress response
MAYDLEEQEQLDTLKAWWKQYGNIVTWTLIAVLAGYAGWVRWNVYKNDTSMQASQLYEELQTATQAKDNTKVQRIASDVMGKYTSSSYASMAALSAAKSAFDANDLKAAKTLLSWVNEHGSTEEYKVLAKLRLAAVSLDEKAYDEGLKWLTGEFPAEFVGEVADRKADILVAQNKLLEARQAYQMALDKLDEKNPLRQLVQLKFDAIGGTEVKVATHVVAQ